MLLQYKKPLLVLWHDPDIMSVLHPNQSTLILWKLNLQVAMKFDDLCICEFALPVISHFLKVVKSQLFWKVWQFLKSSAVFSFWIDIFFWTLWIDLHFAD